MELPRRLTTCALCGRSVDIDRPHFRIRYLDPSGFEGPVGTHSERPSHWDCYVKWPGRPALAKAAVEAVMAELGRDPYCGIVWRHERLAVAVMAEFYDPDQVLLIFPSTGGSAGVFVSDWRDWLGDVDRALEKLGPPERDDLLSVLLLLRRRHPDGPSLTRELDWERIKRRVERGRKQSEFDDQWSERHRGAYPSQQRDEDLQDPP